MSDYDKVAEDSFVGGFLDTLDKLASGKWIQHAIKHEGSLHQELGIPEDEKIPLSVLQAAANKETKSGKTTKEARRARLALTLRKMHHK